MIRRAQRTVGHWILCGFALAAGAWAAGGRPSAETLLRRADLVRNPYLGTAIDVELSVVSRVPSAGGTARELRSSRFTMLTHRADRTLMLLFDEDRTRPGALLIADDAYWLLLPRAERPVELALRYVVAGDLSHAGFLRFNLRVRYRPRDDGEETLDGVPCWRLELEPGDGDAPFGRVRYWIAKEGFLPIRIEFLDAAGELLKTARFARYQDTAVGTRPARIEIEDARRPRELAILTLSQPLGVKTTPLAFDFGDLAALRDAGSEVAFDGDGRVDARRLVEALTAAARDRVPPLPAKIPGLRRSGVSFVRWNGHPSDNRPRRTAWPQHLGGSLCPYP